MLPVYRAISFQEVLFTGGRTKPWLVLVEAEESIEPYVVKLFPFKTNEIHNCVAKEVLGNALAKEFDFAVPDAALIDMDDEFIYTIEDQFLTELLENQDGRIKYGSKQLTGITPFDRTFFNSSQIRDIIEVDTLFAFDFLIRNYDRRIENPNLLVRSNEVFVIDHELAFNINEHTAEEIKKLTVPIDKLRRHAFYLYLKHSQFNKKTAYFNSFEEYVKFLNINKMEELLQQLKTHGFSLNNCNLWLEYISSVKQDSTNFVNYLRGII